MTKKITRYFASVILYAAVFSGLPSAQPDASASRQFENVPEAFLLNFDDDRIYLCLKADENNCPNYPQQAPIEEKKEREDKDENDDETSDEFNDYQKLKARFVPSTTVDLLTSQCKTLRIPLYMLFHSWKHFLS